jgi:hypothetical protein
VVADVTIPFERPRDLSIGETLAFNTICGELRGAIARSHVTTARRQEPAPAQRISPP